jgi:phenylpyruvate tautomerase PptA (4-oxalocrotonate tautomerase family)
MPLWHIYAPKDAYSADDKEAFANRITDLYAQFGLPRFYVSVIFDELPASGFFIGGKPTTDFVRIWIDQIARRVPVEARPRWLARVNETLDPFVRARGLRWEVHIDDTPIDFWTIEGLIPPAGTSEAEKRWAAENRASPYEGPSVTTST